jgi:hypothetical protein
MSIARTRGGGRGSARASERRGPGGLDTQGPGSVVKASKPNPQRLRVPRREIFPLLLALPSTLRSSQVVSQPSLGTMGRQPSKLNVAGSNPVARFLGNLAERQS